MKKSAFLISSIFLFMATDSGAVGFTVRGGGDPDAVQFLGIGAKLNSWLENSTITASVSSAQVTQVLSSLEASLNSTKTDAKAKLVFIKEDISDDAGISKCGLFDRGAGTITINRVCWDRSDLNDKYELVTLELFGLAGSEARYSEALSVRQIKLDEPAQDRQPLRAEYLDQLNLEWVLVFDHSVLRNSETIAVTSPVFSWPTYFRYDLIDRTNETVAFRADTPNRDPQNPCPLEARHILTITKGGQIFLAELRPDRSCLMKFSGRTFKLTAK